MYTQNPLGAWFEGVAGTIYAIGNGNFGYGAYSAVELVTTVLKVGETSTLPDYFKVNAFPNPFNNQVNFNLIGLPNGEYTFKIYSVSGQEVYSMNSRNTYPENRLLAWFGRTYNGEILPSGLYLYNLKSGNLHYNGRVMLQK